MTYQDHIKPFCDFLLGILLLIVSLPVLSFTALLLIVFNSGKVLFIQERLGKDGRLFRIIKFKTMNDRCDGNGILLADCERLTSLGRIIRKLSVDELPQLWNVLKGDMSLIGPRPLIQENLQFYDDHQRKRHRVKPGITGWAQVNGRNAISWPEKIRLDIYYVENISFALDVKILLLTLRQALPIGRMPSDQAEIPNIFIKK